MNKHNRNVLIAFSLLMLSGSAFADDTTVTRTVNQNYIPQFSGTYNLKAASGAGDSTAGVTFSINGSAFSSSTEQSGLSTTSLVKYKSIESMNGAGGMGSVKVTYQTADGSAPQDACIVYYSTTTTSNKMDQATVTYFNSDNNAVHCSFESGGAYKSSDTSTCGNNLPECGPETNYPASPLPIYLVKKSV